MKTLERMKLYDGLESDKTTAQLKTVFLLPRTNARQWVKERIDRTVKTRSAEHTFFPLAY